MQDTTRPLYSDLEPALSQIRLLRLEAAPPVASDQLDTAADTDSFGSSPLRYSLEVVSLDDRPQFYALSYVWGTTEDMKPIIVNDVEVSITQNLHYSLTSLRKANLQGYLWADAVCINQLDNDERSCQVRLMSRIYQEAELVCCQLGEVSPVIMTYLLYRASLKAGSKEDWEQYRNDCTEQGLSIEGQRILAISIMVGQSSYYQLPYFQRMWTLQETLLPGHRGKFWLGENLITDNVDPRRYSWLRYPEFREELADEWCRLATAPRGQMTTMERLVSEALAEGEPPSLDHQMFHIMWHKEFIQYDTGHSDSIHEFRSSFSQLLSITSRRLCSEPRDKIFALLAVLEPIMIDEEAPPLAQAASLLLKTGRRDYLTIDYDKPLQRVIRDALFYCYAFENRDIVSWLCRQYMPQQGAFARKQSLRHLESPDTDIYPTWLPDMTRHRNQHPIFMSERSDEKPALNSVMWLEEDKAKGLSDRLMFSVKPLGRVTEVSTWPAVSVEEAFELLSATMCEAWLQSGKPGLVELHKALSEEYGVPISDWFSGSTSSSIPLQKIHQVVSKIKALLAADNHNGELTQAATFAPYDWFVSTIIAVHDKDTTRHFVDTPWWFAASYYLRSLPADPATYSADQAQIAQQLKHLGRSQLGKAFFVLDSGISGVCSDAVKQGDLVAYAESFCEVLLSRETSPCTDTAEHSHIVNDGEDKAQDTHLLVEYPYVNSLDVDCRLPSLLNQIGAMDDIEIILG